MQVTIAISVSCKKTDVEYTEHEGFVQITWLAVAFFHPDVAVVLRHTGLGVQEGHAHAALGTETGIVASAVFNSLPVELVT